MLKKLLRIDECKLVGVYMLATVVLYGGFWLSYYNIENYITALLIAPAYVGVGLLLLLIGKAVKDGKKDYEFEEKPKFPFIPLITVALTNMAIGSSMAAFFIAVQVQPSRFFGLVLLVMLAYKTVQAALGAIIKNKRLYKLLFTLCIILEIAGAITAGAVSSNAPEIWWQIFYSLALCVFYSMGQIYMRKPHKKEFWNKVMISYLMGFIYIFMLTIALILIILSQGEGADGIGEALANGIAGGIDTGGGKKSKKGKAIKK